VMGEVYEAMVGDEREVLVVEDGTGESMVGYDEAHRQVAIPEAEPQGIGLGDFVTVEITGHNTVYAFGRPV
jgi:threonylcarbamoyladenosine tRNA methylthiotransferase CDKAL1